MTDQRLLTDNAPPHTATPWRALACLWLALAALLIAPARPALSASWALLDGVSGTTLRENDAARPLNPGSLVALMTLYTALELSRPLDPQTTLTVQPQDIERSDGQERIFLTPGSEVSLDTLLRAVAILSARDASRALARYLGPGEQEFVAAMNRLAESLGLTGSRFTSPVAAADQVSTARDLAQLTKSLYQRWPAVRAYGAERSFTYQGNTRTSHNALLWRSQNINGVMADARGDSSVIFARYAGENGGDRALLLAYLSDSTGRSDAARNEIMSLLGAALNDFQTIRVFSADQVLGQLEVYGGQTDTVGASLSRDVWVSLSRQELQRRGSDLINAVIEYRRPLLAPLPGGAEVAVLRVTVVGQEPVDYPLVTSQEVVAGNWWRRFIDSARLLVNAPAPGSVAVGRAPAQGDAP